MPSVEPGIRLRRTGRGSSDTASEYSPAAQQSGDDDDHNKVMMMMMITTK